MSTWHDESDIGNRHIVEKRCQKNQEKEKRDYQVYKNIVYTCYINGGNVFRWHVNNPYEAEVRLQIYVLLF